ncbi:hypothetical protein QE152_g23692 [Popillia japonica]|uniref:DUF4219 domain-containing protein n=1 Tax=Popillia japonica TaxID=7064 RepID=A0AAW1KHS0_POPJA
MGSSEEFKVPKLEETNYFPWSVRTKAALIQKQCWEAIDPGYSAPMSENENRVNQKALSFLLLSVSDNYLEDIGECEQAKNAWSILEDIHTKFGLLHTVMLIRRYSYKVWAITYSNVN